VEAWLTLSLKSGWNFDLQLPDEKPVFVGDFINDFCGGFASAVAGLADVVVVTGNPYHAKNNEAPQCTESLTRCSIDLNPVHVLRDPIEVQSDTFLRLVTRKHLGVPVPVYSFHQPGRLNPAQLSFKVVRVDPALTASLDVIEIAHPQGQDSWFPTHTWSTLFCQSCESGIHLGWRYTSKLGDGSAFDALIVDFGEDNGNAAAVPEPEALQIGIAAPSWMVAAAALSITARSK